MHASNCVTPGFDYNTTSFTYNADLITDGSTYDFEFDDRSEYLEYSFGTDAALESGVEVKYNGDTDSWNYQQMYGLFESTSDNFATLNCSSAGSVCDSSDSLAVRYEWFSSNWDKFAYLVDTTNSSDLTFCEGPKNLKSVLPTDTSALRASPSGTSYAGKEVDFTWASGWVWGLPEACFNWNTGEVKNKTLSVVALDCTTHNATGAITSIVARTLYFRTVRPSGTRSRMKSSSSSRNISDKPRSSYPNAYVRRNDVRRNDHVTHDRRRVQYPRCARSRPEADERSSRKQNGHDEILKRRGSPRARNAPRRSALPLGEIQVLFCLSFYQ